MKIDIESIKIIDRDSDVLPGNLYPAKGGRSSPGTKYWLVVATTERGACCLGISNNGGITSTTTYLKSAMRERPIVGRCDIESITLRLK